MIRWIELDRAQVPDGGGELRLMQRGAEYSIMADGGIELMNSRLSGSEEALARLAWERIEGRPSPRVLIGGLGMGFTLRAALAVLPPQAQVEVAELVPAVVAWAKGPLAGLFAGSLEDPRTSVHESDVAALIAGARSGYDAILLDVDNGPEGLTRRANDALYDAVGLARAQAALTPGGVLAVWSSAPHPRFSAALRQSGLAVEEVRTPARKGKGGAKHVVWLARRR
ncbi:spermidine synthase [Phenylobacterium sp.]|jgi:spermidine synthase|uniref:spermidine synthase n=1 Tax=Phenylobacterium sp. TaxID=1871053 RepID=UPI002E32FB5C|nr:spermidine synthase [Phenylobacterium sp.]HEX2558911.1 spermidine synthase [Phenylobacterium sp.]